ncbi:MAG: class II aldolase/adducin family protein [Streptosporangiaceae bacterium]
MTLLLGDERAAVVRYCGRMLGDRLAVGTSGNLSARTGDLVAVTPSGVDYDALAPELVGVHRLDGSRVEGRLEPTSEMPMHLTAYRVVPGAGAVVHTHSTSATVLSTLVDELPPIHYLVAMFGGPVRVTPYATYGTEALAAGMARAMAGRNAVILGNHGALTVGGTLGEAYSRAVYLEWLCDVYLRARAVGEPRLLPSDEIERVRHKLGTYGQPPTHNG